MLSRAQGVSWSLFGDPMEEGGVHEGSDKGQSPYMRNNTFFFYLSTRFSHKPVDPFENLMKTLTPNPQKNAHTHIEKFFSCNYRVFTGSPMILLDLHSTDSQIKEL